MMWWTTRRSDGFSSTPRIQMSSFRLVGIVTYMYGTVPSGGTRNGCCIVKM